MAAEHNDNQPITRQEQSNPGNPEIDHSTPQLLYHWKPEDMRGNTLYPLNELKAAYPDAYQKEVEKYANREFLLDYIIPPLNCRWNDALFLSPVGPQQIRASLQDLGYDFHGEFYEIDASTLEPEKATIFTFPDIAFEAMLDPDNYVPYTPENVARFKALPEATKKYYKENLTSEGVLFYAYIPHILYKDTLDVSGLDTIRV